MGMPMKIRRVLLLATVFAGAAASIATAQWSGRKNELVIYAVSKGKSDLQIVPVGTTNSGVTARLEIVDPSTVTAAPLGADFPAKLVRVLHREPDDLFELITQIEKTPSPRQLNQSSTKLLFLDGLLRDQNPGSVSVKPLDVTGGLYVPFIRGLAQGPDVAIDTSRFLLWSPTAAVPPFNAVPDGTPSTFGPAGLTGVEVEAVSGVAAFFVAWTNLLSRYPNQGWPEGADVKILDQDAQIGNTSQLIRLRAGKSTPLFTFTSNTHLFVLEGSAGLQPAGGAVTALNLNWYAFVPKGFAISLSNPKPYTGPGATP
jgi:hypothetical protein